MKLQLIRNATLRVHYGGADILVDPLLGGAGVYPPIPRTSNDRRNPLVELPVPVEELIHPDLILVTHVHRDHWDEAAASLLPYETPLVCQPDNEDLLKNQGFKNVLPVEAALEWKHIGIRRTSGRHGTGDIAVAMGPVSGFVLKADGEPTLYIAGDTVYYLEVEQAIQAYQPEIIVVNAGGARFLEGDPITMNAEDIQRVCRLAPYSRIIAVHLEAINHCLETREELRARLTAAGCIAQVDIPQDGEWL